MLLDENHIIAPLYTGFSIVPHQTMTSEMYPYIPVDDDIMFHSVINFPNWTPYITHSEAAIVHIDHEWGEYPPSIIWKFGAGLLIVFISVAGAIISYGLGSKIGFLISIGLLSIGAFIVALALLNGQEINDTGKL
jgi:hypothetical protein